MLAMAVVHGKSGQYAKAEAKKRTRHTVNILMLLAGTCGLFVGIVGFLLNTYVIYVVLGGVVLFAIVSIVGIRKLETYLERINVERIKYLRGAQAEALVAWLLQDLDDSWHVFNGIKLEATSDLDHVVIGPSGVYYISTKSFRGLFEISADETLLHNGVPTKLLESTFAQAMSLRDRMVALLGDDAPFVSAVLALPFGFIKFNVPHRNVWVLHQDDLVKVLQQGGKQFGMGKLERYVKCIEMLRVSAEEIYQRPIAMVPVVRA